MNKLALSASVTILLAIFSPAVASEVMCSVARAGEMCIPDNGDAQTTVEKNEVLDAFGFVGYEWNCIHNWNYRPQNTDDVIHSCKIPKRRYNAAMDLIIRDYRDMGGDDNSSAAKWVDAHCHAEPAIPHNKWVCVEDDVIREWR